MAGDKSNKTIAENQPPKPLVPHVLVSILVGIGFVLAVGLVVLLPGMIVLHLIDWLELSGFGLDLSWIIALWALSAIVTVAGYYLIQRTFVNEVLNRRVVAPLSDEISDD